MQGTTENRKLIILTSLFPYGNPQFDLPPETSRRAIEGMHVRSLVRPYIFFIQAHLLEKFQVHHVTRAPTINQYLRNVKVVDHVDH